MCDARLRVCECDCELPTEADELAVALSLADWVPVAASLLSDTDVVKVAVKMAVSADFVGDTELVPPPPEKVTRLTTRERDGEGTNERVASGGDAVEVGVVDAAVALGSDVTVPDKETVLNLETVAEDEKLCDRVAEKLLNEAALDWDMTTVVDDERLLSNVLVNVDETSFDSMVDTDVVRDPALFVPVGLKVSVSVCDSRVAVCDLVDVS